MSKAEWEIYRLKMLSKGVKSFEVDALYPLQRGRYTAVSECFRNRQHEFPGLEIIQWIAGHLPPAGEYKNLQVNFELNAITYQYHPYAYGEVQEESPLKTVARQPLCGDHREDP